LSFPYDGPQFGSGVRGDDRLLDEACEGTFYLRQPAIADMM
jgi:hypothetical protein